MSKIENKFIKAVKLQAFFFLGGGGVGGGGGKEDKIISMGAMHCFIHGSYILKNKEEIQMALI